MSTLTLVRHGQAYPFHGESAALTSLGETQAAKLAQFWLRNQVQFDDVYCGALPRQVRTEQVVAECFRSSGLPWPEARTDRSWNEYDASGVLQHLVPAGDFQTPGSGPEGYRRFQRMFEAAMLSWLEAVADTHGVESWKAFRDRLSGAIQRLMQGPASRRVVVFTSGGPIGFAVQFALHAPPRSFLDVNWRVRNSSITQFVFDRNRLTLDSFNGIPHLDDTALCTYR